MWKKRPGESRPCSRGEPEDSFDDSAGRIRVSGGGASLARLSVEEARHPETDRHAKIQNAYLRGIEEGPRGPGGPTVGLAPQQAEPGGRALPRPEGPLRDHAARGPARRPVRGRDGPLPQGDGPPDRREGLRSGRRRTSTRSWRPARSRSRSRRSRSSGVPTRSRSASSPRRTPRRTRGSGTGTSTSGGRRCIAISSCARRSSRASAGG